MTHLDSSLFVLMCCGGVLGLVAVYLAFAEPQTALVRNEDAQANWARTNRGRQIKMGLTATGCGEKPRVAGSLRYGAPRS